MKTYSGRGGPWPCLRMASHTAIGADEAELDVPKLDVELAGLRSVSSGDLQSSRLLEHLAARIRGIEVTKLPALLDTALCFDLLPSPVPPTMDPLELIAATAALNSASGQQCGYIFRDGDIAWVCRDCQTDDTCVLCEDCFSSSDHEGHQVFFHRTRAGGCCDCGDLEAWKAEGCCPRHRGGKEVCELPSSVSRTARSRQRGRIRPHPCSPLGRTPPCFAGTISLTAVVRVHVRSQSIAGFL